jgi:hypothetical protein
MYFENYKSSRARNLVAQSRFLPQKWAKTRLTCICNFKNISRVEEGLTPDHR